MTNELHPHETTRRARVVVVDDDPFYVAAVLALLEADGRIEVVGQALGGAAAVRAALELRPDIVLMDMRMPHMDGFDATRQIRELINTVEVLIVTASATRFDVADAAEAGAAGLLKKDQVIEELVDTVLATVASAQRPFAGRALLTA